MHFKKLWAKIGVEQILFLILLPFGIRSLLLSISPYHPPGWIRQATGGIILLSGLIVQWRALIDLVHYSHGFLLLRAPRFLARIGFYARNRHPWSWGWLIYLTGFLLLAPIPSLHIVATILCLLLVFRFWWGLEEKKLARKFGEAYQEYRDRVPLWYWNFTNPERLVAPFVQQVTWLASLLYFRWNYYLTVSGIENIPAKGPFYIIAFHGCYFDPFLFGVFVPHQIHFVTTSDVYTHPFLRFALHNLSTIPLRRHYPDLPALRRVLQLLHRGGVVGIFPEGGRTIDGTPQPIVKETLRLLKKPGVPLLPVKLFGTYEIWPRWAPNRRRGKVRVQFLPPLPPASPGESLDEFNSRIERAIFDLPECCFPVKSARRAEKIEILLWACPHCNTPYSLRGRRNHIKCSHCGSFWFLSQNYHLEKPGEAPLPLIDAVKKIRSSVTPLKEQIQLPWLKPQEKLYIRVERVTLRIDDQAELSRPAVLVLTSSRIAFGKGKRWTFFDLGAIRVFTIDFQNSISLGYRDRRWRFYLPSPEQPQRWLDTYNVLVSNVNQLSN